jgi:hypothetical protein
VRRLLALALLLLAAGGCYRVRFVRSSLAPEPGAARERWVHGLFGNSFQLGGPVRVDALCPTGVASLTHEVTAVNALVQGLAALPLPVAGALLASRAQVRNPGLPLEPPSAVDSALSYYVFGRHLSLWTPSTIHFLCARGSLSSRKVAMMRLTPRPGVDEGLAAQLSDVLAGEMRKAPGVSVLTDADIAAVLGLERQKQLLGCSDSSCLAELGGALGVDRLVHGSLGKVGESYLVHLASVDPRSGAVVGSASERIAGSADALLDALPRMARQLLTELPSSAP